LDSKLWWIGFGLKEVVDMGKTTTFAFGRLVSLNAGFDDILYCTECSHCANVEVSKVSEGGACPKCGKGVLKAARASEVGNIFDLGQKYSKDFNFKFKSADGSEKQPIMGCYGIGLTRLMGVIVEALSDEKGIVWPETVAPFRVHLLALGETQNVLETADKMYGELLDAGVEVLYDDRRISNGEKFADADLLGMPYRIVVSERSLKEGGAEIKKRTEEKGTIMPFTDVIGIVSPKRT
jgi:prolyl-tRNA synthetase